MKLHNHLIADSYKKWIEQSINFIFHKDIYEAFLDIYSILMREDYAKLNIKDSHYHGCTIYYCYQEIKEPIEIWASDKELALAAVYLEFIKYEVFKMYDNIEE